MKVQLKVWLITAIFMLSAVPFLLQAQNTPDWAAPKEADLLTNPLKGNADAIKEGKTLYTTYCAACHGDKGKGDGVAGTALNPRPADFASERIKKESDGALYWKMTNGNPPMAPYKDVLTEKQRWELVNYIRTLSNN